MEPRTCTRKTPKRAFKAMTGKRTKQYNWVVEQACAEDEKMLLELFYKAFKHEMPVQQWRWKYARSQPMGTLVREDDKVVAFYGAMPREIQLFGRSDIAVQIGDVMVEPSRRRILTRRGPFFLAASAFSERFVGSGKPYCYAFGFPSDRHNRLGEHLGLYARVGKVFEANWRPLSGCIMSMTKSRPLPADCLTVIDQLWQEMADDLIEEVVPVRDSQYIQRRFLTHPTIEYKLVLVERRFSGRPLGLLVLRDLEDDGIELLDMVAPLRQIPLLVKVARQLTGSLKRPRLFAWLTRPVADVLKGSQCALKKTDVDIPTFIWEQPEKVLEIRDHWWLMGGDSDFR